MMVQQGANEILKHLRDAIWWMGLGMEKQLDLTP
jgi:hypothetical protein